MHVNDQTPFLGLPIVSVGKPLFCCQCRSGNRWPIRFSSSWTALEWDQINRFIPSMCSFISSSLLSCSVTLWRMIESMPSRSLPSLSLGLLRLWGGMYLSFLLYWTSILIIFLANSSIWVISAANTKYFSTSWCVSAIWLSCWVAIAYGCFAMPLEMSWSTNLFFRDQNFCRNSEGAQCRECHDLDIDW